MTTRSFHEDLSRDEAPAGSTDRAFGLTIGGVCVAVGIAVLGFGKAAAWWWLGIGGALLAAGMGRPSLLAPLNRAWTRLGLLLFHVVNPVVMAIMFFLCIVPLGLVMRLFRKDPLRLQRDPAAKTYWQGRDTEGAGDRSMRNQF